MPIFGFLRHGPYVHFVVVVWFRFAALLVVFPKSMRRATLHRRWALAYADVGDRCEGVFMYGHTHTQPDDGECGGDLDMGVSVRCPCVSVCLACAGVGNFRNL